MTTDHLDVEFDSKAFQKAITEMAKVCNNISYSSEEAGKALQRMMNKINKIEDRWWKLD